MPLGSRFAGSYAKAHDDARCYTKSPAKSPTRHLPPRGQMLQQVKSSNLLSLLIFAAAMHFLVDTVAGMLNPLWPRLDAHYRLAGWESAALFFLWQMTT